MTHINRNFIAGSPIGRNIATALLVLVAGVGVLADGAHVHAASNPSPTSALKNMLANLYSVKSFKYAVDAKFTITDKESLDKIRQTVPGGQKVTGVKLGAKGSFDATDSNNPKVLLTLDLSTVPAVKDLSAKLEARVVDKVSYVKFNTVPRLTFFDASPFKGQWMRIKPETLESQLGAGGIAADLSSSTPQVPAQLTAEQTEKIRAALKKASLFVVKKEFPRAKVGGVESFHYALALDKKGVKDYVHEVLAIISRDKPLTVDEANQLAEAEDAFGKKLDKAELPPLELWVGTVDMLPRQLSLEIKVKPTDSNTGKPREAGKISLTISLGDFNKPVTVDAPSGAKDLNEALGPLMESPQ